jgi:hypothetical protein
MNDSDKERFSLVIEQLCAGYGKEPTVPLLQFYWTGLRSLAFAELEFAATKAAERCRFMPTPAELRELAGASAPKPAGAALIALEQVRRAIRAHGRRGTFDFGDPMIHACIRGFGGWTALCNSDPDWTAQRWVKTWESLAGVGVTPQFAAPVEGGEEGPVHRLGPTAQAALEEAPTPPLRVLPPMRGGER